MTQGIPIKDEHNLFVRLVFWLDKLCVAQVTNDFFERNIRNFDSCSIFNRYVAFSIRAKSSDELLRCKCSRFGHYAFHVAITSFLHFTSWTRIAASIRRMYVPAAGEDGSDWSS